MAYNDNLSQPKDIVRFLLGDTDATDENLSDGEINFLLSENGGNPYLAAVQGAEKVQGNYSTKASKTVGPLRITYDSQAKGWGDLAESLRRRAAKGARPLLTADEGKEPAFRIGMMSNPDSRSWGYDS